ncbi:sodium:galactoside symporter [Spirochaetia bacterium]|nr:sodium:galactoside symporter [Spirochaetia bacterium]
MDKKSSLWHTSGKERFAYAVYFSGQLIFYTMVASFTLTYLLNAGLNEIMVGSILVIPKIWDAVNDTLFGVVVDKVHFKKGRFMPWVRLSAILLPAATILFFSMPKGISETAQIIWVIVGYILWDSAYTVSDVPIYALSTSMTSDIAERTSILSVTRITGAMGGIAISILVPSLYGANGANLGWSLTAIVLSVLGFICMLPICLFGKERFHAEQVKESSLKDMWNGFRKNKYLLVFQIARFICNFTITLDVLNAVFAQYVIGDETFGSVMSMAIGLPTIIVAMFIPMIARKWDKVYVTAFFMAFFALVSIAQYFIGYQNHTTVLLLTALKCMGYGGYMTLSYMFVPDCIEYGQYKTGKRNEGVSFGLQTFVSKLDSALVATIGAFIISILGFSSQNVTVQGKNAVWFAITIFTAIGPAIAIPILLLTYKLRDKYVKVMSSCNNGEITREESNKLLDKKF